jgi:hypothetical protein
MRPAESLEVSCQRCLWLRRLDLADLLVPRCAEFSEAVLVGRLGGVLGAGIFLSATRLDLLTWKPLGLPFSTCRFTVFVQ